MESIIPVGGEPTKEGGTEDYEEEEEVAVQEEVELLLVIMKTFQSLNRWLRKLLMETMKLSLVYIQIFIF